MNIINLRKFLILCFIDFILATIINEKHEHLGYYLYFPLALISFALSVEKEDINIENEYQFHADKSNTMKNNQEDKKLYSSSGFKRTKTIVPKPKPKNTPKYINKNEVTDDLFDSNENYYYYKNIDKSPNFPSFDKLKSTRDHHFNKKKVRISRVNLNNLNAIDKSKIDIPKIDKKDTFIISGPEFKKKAEVRDLIIKIGNDNKILFTGRQIKAVLESEKKSYKKGLNYLAEQILGFMRDNKAERRAAYYGYVLSVIVPFNDPNREFFEKCMYHKCEQANPYQKPSNIKELPDINQKSDISYTIWEDSDKDVVIASVLFCYWCFIDDIEKIFSWLKTHSIFIIDERPDFPVGLCFDNLIRFAGKKIFDTDPNKTRQLIDDAYNFLIQYIDQNIFTRFSYWRGYDKIYKRIPKDIDDFRNCIKANDENTQNKLKNDYDKCRSLIKYFGEQI